LETRRGALVIRNRGALQAKSCGCETELKIHSDQLTTANSRR
jgi:hypothetical protein